MPSTCNDLLPDIQDYISFTEETAELMVNNNPDLSKKLYELLSIRKMYQNNTRESYNPIDDLIKNYLCFCLKQNSNELFTSNSNEIRNFFKVYIDKMILKAENKYIEIEVQNKLKYFAKLQAQKNRRYIRQIKRNALKSVKKRLSQNIENELKKLTNQM
jgi:hypothetical protein